MFFFLFNLYRIRFLKNIYQLILIIIITSLRIQCNIFSTYKWNIRDSKIPFLSRKSVFTVIKQFLSRYRLHFPLDRKTRFQFCNKYYCLLIIFWNSFDTFFVHYKISSLLAKLRRRLNNKNNTWWRIFGRFVDVIPGVQSKLAALHIWNTGSNYIQSVYTPFVSAASYYSLQYYTLLRARVNV